MKETTKAFFRHLLSVVLGIIITFSVQGIIDRAHVRREVRSALELVRAELVANIDDINTMSDYLRQQRKSAEYFLANRTTLAKCPTDSIYFHSGFVFADASITISQDALELLKMSSLFQKIGDNDTSMKIIRAYDTCSSAVTVLNHHIEERDELFKNSINETNVRRVAGNGSIDIKEYMKTGYGLYVIRWLSDQISPDHYADVSDLEDAIKAIDSYLAGKQTRRNHKSR
jgi:hypothetical protein